MMKVVLSQMFVKDDLEDLMFCKKIIIRITFPILLEGVELQSGAHPLKILASESHTSLQILLQASI